MHFLTALSNLLTDLRPILEALYFLAAIVLAGVAVYSIKQVTIALEQVRVTKEIANKSATREAFKLAADQCRDFGAVVIPMGAEVTREVRARNLHSFFGGLKFKISEDDEIVEHIFNLVSIESDLTKHTVPIVNFVNRLEGFAMFFESGIADESIAYRVTARPFCQAVEAFMPAIFLLRARNLGVHESTLKLYRLWSAKLESEALEKTQKATSVSLAKAQSTIQKSGIRPLRDA